MKNLPQWGQLCTLAGATLAYYFGMAWWKNAKREANRGECGQPFRLTPGRALSSDEAGLLEQAILRARASQPDCPYDDDTEDADWWCPAHVSWYAAETECPACRDEWEQTWALGEEPEWPTQAEIEHYEANEGADGWYRDLVRRAEMGHDGSDERRVD